MDYRATAFSEFPALSDRVRALLGRYFETTNEADGAEKWRTLTARHDDWAAALLSVAAALSRVNTRVDGQAITGLDLVEELHLLAGDRLYARLAQASFQKWRATAQFEIRLANGTIESGRVQFNRGQLGASLHRGFDIQGVTALNRLPRIQWSVRLCDGLADVDLDGFSPWDPVRHFTYANSDPRQWYDDYKKKYGEAGFAVERVGNVPELRIEDESVCPTAGMRMTSAEQGETLAAVNDVTELLASTNDFRTIVEMSRLSLEPVLRDVDLSPLASEVEVNARRDSTSDDLLGYYAARIDVERLTRGSLAVAGTSPMVRRAAAIERAVTTVTTPGELRAARSLLETEAETHRQRARAIARSVTQDATTTVRARAWLSVDSEPAFGYPADTRFVAAETNELQFLFAPAANHYELLFAVPRTKF
jgi:hypothetical protein